MVWIIWQLAVFLSVWLTTKYSEKIGLVVSILWTIESIVFLWFISPLQILQLAVVWLTFNYFKKCYHSNSICTNCNKEINNNSQFCKHCGYKIGN